MQLLHAAPEHDARTEVEDELIGSGQMSENGEEQDRQWDESHTDDGPAIKPADDINAASLALDIHPRSYLGASSISAVLRTIFRFCPGAKSEVAQSAKTWPKMDMADRIVSPPITISPSAADSARFVAAYFEHVHAITPMLNEVEFRATYESASRMDTPWCGLLNMVMVLGSLAAGDDQMHDFYYSRAQSYLNLDSLGAGNLEVLQAFCLLGGYYLHYRNAPNMAYAILGAAHRVAIALGLHRESRKTPPAADSAQFGISRAEIRRRTWWSFVCLDTWASITLGRPTCGRYDPSTMDTSLPSASDQNDVFAISLHASSKFCVIANRIQHRFARLTNVTACELIPFDDELIRWHASLPPILAGQQPCVPRLVIARDFMRNRYLNLRSILGRSVILNLASGRSRKDYLGSHESTVVDSCHSAACAAVDSISINWTPNLFHVWNAAWYLFQACMVNLLSIAMETSTRAPNEDVMLACKSSITKALEVFAEMTPWMRRSDRSRDIVFAVYKAVSAEGSRRTPSVTDGDSTFFGFYDEELTFGNDLDWSKFLVDDESLALGYASTE